MTKSTSSLWETLGTLTITHSLLRNQPNGRETLSVDFSHPSLSLSLQAPTPPQLSICCCLLSPHNFVGGGWPGRACLTCLHPLKYQTLSDATWTDTLPILSNICFILFFSPLVLPLFGREINLTQVFPHAKNQRPYADSIYLVQLKIAQAGRKHFSWQTSKLDPTAVYRK